MNFSETVNFLTEVIRLIEQYPVLANHRPTFDPAYQEITWFSFWDAGKIIETTPDFGWREEWPNMETRDIDAVATVNGVNLRVRCIRELERQNVVEAFVHRDLKPSNKEFVEASL